MKQKLKWCHSGTSMCCSSFVVTAGSELVRDNVEEEDSPAKTSLSSFLVWFGSNANDGFAKKKKDLKAENRVAIFSLF